VLGRPPDLLARLGLCRRPGAAEPSWTAEQGLQAVAGHFGFNAAALRRVVPEMAGTSAET
jgi:hypothetical protein